MRSFLVVFQVYLSLIITQDTSPWISFRFFNPTVEELDSYSVFETLSNDLQSSRNEVSELNVNIIMDINLLKKGIDPTGQQLISQFIK